MLGLNLGLPAVAFRGGLLVPSLDLDFLGGQLDSRITFARTSTGTRFTSAGLLETVAADVARFDYDPTTLQPRGLLIEESRTNSVRNSGNLGGVAGSPGTTPTNWQIITASGLTTNVLGLGTENGFPYIDIQLVGTTNNTSYALSPESVTQVTAANGQSWAGSVYVKQIGGSQANITNTRISVTGRTTGSAGVSGQSAFTNLSPGASLSRGAAAFTFTDATVARVSTEFRLVFSSGVAIDVSFRLAGFQLEQGAFATSWIPTTTAAATRANETATISSISPWFNAAEGTLMIEASRYALRAGTTFVGFSDGTTQNFMGHVNGVGTPSQQRADVVVAGTTQAQFAFTGTATVDTIYRQVFAYRVNDFAGSINGAAALTDTLGTVPTVDRLQIGINSASSVWLGGHIRRVRYWNSRRGNAELPAITA